MLQQISSYKLQSIYRRWQKFIYTKVKSHNSINREIHWRWKLLLPHLLTQSMLDTSSSSIYTISKSGYRVCWHGKTRSNDNKMRTSNSTCCQSTFCSYQGSSLWLDHTCMKVALILHPLGISVPYSGKKIWRKIFMRKELDVLNLLKKNTHTENSLFLLSMPFATYMYSWGFCSIGKDIMPN